MLGWIIINVCIKMMPFVAESYFYISHVKQKNKKEEKERKFNSFLFLKTEPNQRKKVSSSRIFLV